MNIFQQLFQMVELWFGFALFSSGAWGFLSTNFHNVVQRRIRYFIIALLQLYC